MENLQPIPSPPGHHWREFKFQVIPALLFVIIFSLMVITWKDHVSAPYLVGEVETLSSQLRSPKAGSISEMKVFRLQHVTRGEPLAKITTTEPKILESSLAVIRAEIELLKVGMAPIQGQQRAILDYQKLRLDWMVQRIDLAGRRVRLQEAEMEAQRYGELFNQKLLSKEDYERRISARDLLKTEIDEKDKLVNEFEKSLGSIQSVVTPGAGTNSAEAVTAAIAVQEEKLKLTEAELSPVVIYAPMDGFVNQIIRHSGENVAAGEPIASISSAQSEHILGFVRQPSSFEPKTGMTVEVRPRSGSRTAARSKIIEVGTQMEPFLPSLITSNTLKAETGLPILIATPTNMKLMPGELVDLLIIPGDRPVHFWQKFF